MKALSGGKKAKPETNGVVDTSGVIARTNRFFLQLKSYGHCDAKGKLVMALSGFDRMLALPDRPLCSLFLPLVEILMQHADYSSPEAMRADLAQFQGAIKTWKVKKCKSTTPNPRG